MEAIRKQSIEAYLNFVSANQRLPRTLSDLAMADGLSVSSLRSTFSSIHSLAEQLWESIIFTAGAEVVSSVEFSTYTTQEQIVALFMGLIDAIASHPSLVEATMRPHLLRPLTKGVPLIESSLGIRKALRKLIPSLLAHARSQGSVASGMVLDRWYCEGMVGSFLAALSFWITDSSAGKLQTEAFVDHLARVIATALRPGLGHAMADLGTFFARSRILPLAASAGAILSRRDKTRWR